MRDPDEWRRGGRHWHAYSESRIDGEPSTRTQRLLRPPENVLTSPSAVAEWFSHKRYEHLPRWPIKFLVADTGWGHLADDEHLQHELVQDEIIAARGDSVYLSFPREHDHLDLWAEAVTLQECPEPQHLRR